MTETRELDRWQNGLMRAKGAMESFHHLARLAVDPVDSLFYQEASNHYARMVRRVERKIRELNGRKARDRR